MDANLPPLLSYIKAEEARDAALQRVADNSAEWLKLALIQLEQFGRQRDGWANTEHGVIGEDIRRMLVPLIGHPSHNNVFGALIRQALRRKIITPWFWYSESA